MRFYGGGGALPVHSMLLECDCRVPSQPLNPSTVLSLPSLSEWTTLRKP